MLPDSGPAPAARLHSRVFVLILSLIAGILATVAEVQPRARVTPQLAPSQAVIRPVEDAPNSGRLAFGRFRAGRHTRWQADRAQVWDGVDAPAVELPSTNPRLVVSPTSAGDRIPASTRAHRLPSVRSPDSIRAPPRA